MHWASPGWTGLEMSITEGDKVREARMKWFGHVQRRDNGYIGQRMLTTELLGRRRSWFSLVKAKLKPYVHNFTKIIKNFYRSKALKSLKPCAISEEGNLNASHSSRREQVEHKVGTVSDINYNLLTIKTAKLSVSPWQPVKLSCEAMIVF